MDGVGYVALAGQVASVNHLSVVTNNTANSATPGFKGDNVLFQEWLYRDMNNKGSMPVDAKTVTDHTQGHLQQTNSRFDLAISGRGFFALRGEDGILKLTRNGRFMLSADGSLRDVHGRRVVDVDGNDIFLAENVTSFDMSRNGAIFANGEQLTTIGVFDFPQGAKPLKTQYGDFVVEGAPELVDMSDTSVVQGMLEASNVNSVMGLVDLTEVSKQVDRNNVIMHSNRESMRTAYKVFSNEQR